MTGYNYIKKAIYLHSDFENSQKPQSSENGQAERFAVDPWPQGPHPEQHLEDEETQKYEFGSV